MTIKFFIVYIRLSHFHNAFEMVKHVQNYIWFFGDIRDYWGLREMQILKIHNKFSLSTIGEFYDSAKIKVKKNKV
jgi:hypothetical protein